MDTTEEQNAIPLTTTIDQAYEFTASQWFDFLNEETNEQKQRSELWFESALSYAPSRKFSLIVFRLISEISNPRIYHFVFVSLNR